MFHDFNLPVQIKRDDDPSEFLEVQNDLNFTANILYVKHFYICVLQVLVKTSNLIIFFGY